MNVFTENDWLSSADIQYDLRESFKSSKCYEDRPLGKDMGAGLVPVYLRKIPELNLKLQLSSLKCLKGLGRKDLKNPFHPLNHSLKETSSESLF